MMFIIYKVTNLINNKIYIGKHKCKKLDDSYFGSGDALKPAIKKYGKENFVFHLEFVLHNQYEMDLLEKMVVNQDFLKRNDVYNISEGGPNCILYGEKNGFYGKHHSKELCEKISKLHKGLKHTEDSKRRISETLKINYQEHPEIKDKIKANEGRVVINKDGRDLFVDPDNIPYGEGYVVGSHKKVMKDKPHTLISKSDRIRLIRENRKQNVNRKWYNNGKEEIWAFDGEVPEGFVRGRLAGINIGRHYTPGTILKMSQSHIGIEAHNKGKIFITNGKENRYVEDESEIPEGWKKGLHMNRHRNVVVQMDKELNIIAEYESVTVASKVTGIKIGQIYKSCSALRDDGDYIWSYKIDMVYFF